jgi:hypothetical protein
VTFAPGTQRRLLIVGGLAFGTFAIATLVIRRLDGSDQTLSLVGGVVGYVFLVVAVVILVRGWRNRGAGDKDAVGAFLRGHPAVAEAVGSPVSVGRAGGDVLGRGHGQATLSVPVSGPAGRGTAEIVMARLGREWEILGGTLEVHGERVPLGHEVRSDAS